MALLLPELLLPELRGDSIMQQVGCAFILAGKKSGLGTGGFFKNRDIRKNIQHMEHMHGTEEISADRWNHFSLISKETLN